jgi:hypothetical protein
MAQGLIAYPTDALNLKEIQDMLIQWVLNLAFQDAAC